MPAAESSNWRSLVAPAGLCAFVIALGAMPYMLFWSDQGSFGAFTSAYDESTYLLDGPFVPYRLLSDLALGAVGLLTPGPGSQLLVADLVLPVIVALAAWGLVTRCLTATGLRLLAVLALLFGQEFLSLANSIVWPGAPLMDLRTSGTPLSLELIPDATTSYFSLFRTPEPQVSWAILFVFLALIAGPDPLRAFEGARRWLTLPIFAVLPFIYPFISVPILVLAAVLLAYATVAERPRAIGVLVAVGIAIIGWVGVALAAAGGGSDASSSVLFASRLPTVTPAILIGVAIAAFMLVVYRTQVFRRGELLVAFAAALIPAAVGNQQVVTGLMVSARDWERSSSYAVVTFALIVLIGSKERSGDGLPRPAHALAWTATALLVVSLLGFQRRVYDAWSPANIKSHAAADLLESLPSALAERPIVMEDASLVPQVRVLTDDEFEFVLDYTRLFNDPIPAFADGWEDSDAQATSQGRLFEYWFRLGRSSEDVESLLDAELADDTVFGFYGHFLFAFRDVLPPLTDWRGLNRDEALEQVPEIVSAYGRFVREREEQPGLPVILITDVPPDDPGDGRRLELIASAKDGTQLYVESFR